MEIQNRYEGWRGFREGSWVNEIDLRSFIRHNFTMYDGDETFLEGPTQNTLDLWDQVMDLTRQEREAGGVLDMDTKVISGITSHGPGYLDKEKETIVGFQTDKPFKRAMMPYGGVRMAMSVPAPSAMPTSALVRAGASLMPSPTIATMPASFREFMTPAFSSGKTPAIISSTPHSLPMAFAVFWLSPVSIMVLMPSFFIISMANIHSSCLDYNSTTFVQGCQEQPG